jgi:hypothetical protein
MRVSTASEAGDVTTPNEDWACASEGLVVVLDGATARTDTGCRYGVAWYTAKLGSALTVNAVDRGVRLGDALADAIGSTAEQHRDCDLTHPGTPSASDECEATRKFLPRQP